MDWLKLIKLIPLVAGAADPRVATLAKLIEEIAEKEIARRSEVQPVKTRDEIIAEAGALFDDGISEAEALLKKGHDSPE